MSNTPPPPSGGAPGPSPADILKALGKAKGTPEKTDASKQSEALFEEYKSEERAIHGYQSLEKSREHVAELLKILPEFNRTVMGEKAIEQELKLQESIRVRDYSDAEITTHTRRFLTTALAIATIALFVVVIFSYLGAGIWKWDFEDAKFKSICAVLGVSFVSWVGTLLAYYYRPRR